MNSLHKLASFFAEFPGIGPRQAKRFVYFLLTRHQGYLDELASLITSIKKDMRTCISCQRFFISKAPDVQTCDICSSVNRDTSLLTVVGRDIDLENIEKTGAYNGLYFVLGGSVPVLEPTPEKRIRSAELIKTIEHRASKGLKEIILAMNANAEGEHTADVVHGLLTPLTSTHGIKVSTLGRGLSTGTELEYSDTDTLKNAFKNRA